jgi:phosphate/sulfate permease
MLRSRGLRRVSSVSWTLSALALRPPGSTDHSIVCAAAGAEAAAESPNAIAAINP